MLGFHPREHLLQGRDLEAQPAPALRSLVVGLGIGSRLDSAAATSRGSTPVCKASRAALAAIAPAAEDLRAVAVTNVPLPCWLSIMPSCSRRW
jgi:hypothetical protein